MDDLKSVIDKVKKLQSLSKSNNINEAAAATAAANKIIDQYRLLQIDLEFTNVESSEPIEEDFEFVYETGRITQWKVNLAMVLAQHYGCYIYNDNITSSGRKQSRLRLVGRRSDMAIHKYMFNWLQLECKRFSLKEAKGFGRVYVDSYCRGFVNGIRTQLDASRLEVTKDANQASLIKINKRESEAKDFINSKKNLITTKTKSFSYTDKFAYALGLDKGNKIHLGESLSNGVNGRLLNK